MIIMKQITGILDLIISQALLLIGIYLFFIKQDFVGGAILIGSHSLYPIPGLLLNLKK